MSEQEVVGPGERVSWQWGVAVGQELRESAVYELSFAEAQEVVEGYGLALDQIRAAGHQLREGIVLNRGWKNKAIAEAVSELVGLTPEGESQLGMRAICEPQVVEATF